METFDNHVHTTKREWLNIPTKDRVELIGSLAKVDETAVVRMKMAGRECVRKGKCTEKFLEEFYSVVDMWLGELKHTESGIPVYKKIAAITYARNLAM
jgi:hypothetical protein